MVELEEETKIFPPDTTVWAKIGSHPWWPAKIEALEDLPHYALIEKPNSKCVPVYFFGTHQFGFPPLKNLIKFEDNMIYEKKCKQKSFIKGLEEIKDKSCWPEKGSFRESVLHESEPDVEVGDDHDQYDMEVEKPRKEKKPKKRKASLPSMKKASVADKKRKKEVLSERDILMKLRMKLQLFLQNKEPYTEQDFIKADEYLNSAENIKMNIELFKETKIAKVIKHLAKKDIKERNISERCNVLTQKWIKEVELVVVDVAPNGISKGNSQESLESVDTISPMNMPPSPKKKKSPRKSDEAKDQNLKKDVDDILKPNINDGTTVVPAISKYDYKKKTTEGSESPNSPLKICSPITKSPKKESIKVDTPKSPLKSYSPTTSPKSPAKALEKSESPKSPLKTLSSAKDIAAPKSPSKEWVKGYAPKSPLKSINPNNDLAAEESTKLDTAIGIMPKSPIKTPLNVNK